MRRYPAATALIVALLTLAGVAALTGHPALTRATMLAGDCHVLTVRDGVTLSDQVVDPSVCAAYDPTATATAVPPTATALPATATATGCPGVDDLHWHPPVVNGCATGHEHGDQPPSWVVTSAWMPMFQHPGNTPNENVLKHSSFKGFALRDDGVDVYVIAHLDTNPSGHASRFHSVQVWARDATGAVSHWDLWMDFGEGDDTGPHLQPPDACGGDGHRPIMTVDYQHCPSVVFETWYSRAGAPEWGWDFGFSISPNYYAGSDPAHPSSPDLAQSATWLPTGGLNTNRRMETAWYANRPHPTGTFYSTQFGQRVSGPTDPRCGQPQTIGGKTYTTLCIQQFIAPSMTTVSFPSNSVQRQYDARGVRLPN